MENVKITWQGGASPMAIFKDAEGVEISRTDLTDMTFPALLSLFESKGLKPKRKYVAPAAGPIGQFEVGTTRYVLFDRSVYKDDAEIKATEHGGILYAFPKKEEHDLVFEKLVGLGGSGAWKYIWTGAYVDDGMWYFKEGANDAPSVIRNLRGEYPWAFQQPKQKGGECGVINHEGKMEDVDCTTFTANVLVEIRGGAGGGSKEL
jgi:hypothetical protein